MALSEIAGSTQAATVNTEHTLATDTTGGTRVLGVCLQEMLVGDAVELRLYSKMRAGSTEYLAYQATYQHNQVEPNVYSTPLPANIHCRATLKQTAGTGRSFEWALLGL